MVAKMPQLEEMLEAGMHFGHKTFRWHPGMKPFIFGERDGIHIIDLEKSLELLEKALAFVEKVAQEGAVLFVGTKKQAALIVREEAEKCNSPYVVSRWPGGLLTNFSTVLKSLKRLNELDRLMESPLFTKKDKRRLEQRKKNLESDFAGIASMATLPQALFVIDLLREKTAVKEAQRLGIPIVGLVDTNVDPSWATYPIPGNDDASGSIALVTGLVAEAILAGQQKGRERAEAEAALLKEETPELLAKPEVIAAAKEQEQIKEKKSKSHKVAKIKGSK